MRPTAGRGGRIRDRQGGSEDLGPVEELRDPPLRQVLVGRTKIALSCIDGEFGAISGVCNHVGGPLGEGRLLWINRKPSTRRHKAPHPPHPLARDPEPRTGPPRVLGISAPGFEACGSTWTRPGA